MDLSSSSIKFSRCWRSIVAMLLSTLALHVSAQTVTLGGVGSVTPLIKRLAQDFRKTHPEITIIVADPPIGTAGGIRALAAGKVDIAVIGRDLWPGEPGKPRPWLKTPFVLATNGGKTGGLSLAQVADVYAGRKVRWDDGAAIRLVLRGAHESETIVLRKLSPAIDVAVDASLKRTGLPIADTDLEALRLLGSISGSLGTTSLGLLKAQESTLSVVPVDGKHPSAEALQAGSYPWARVFNLVALPEPKPAAAAFLNYLGSAAAMKLARQFEYLPAP